MCTDCILGATDVSHCRCSWQVDSEGQGGLGEAAVFRRAASPIHRWVLKTLGMLLLLSAASFAIYFAPPSLIVLAALPVTPYMCLVNDLRSDFDSLLMIYQEERRSLVMFWVNVLQVRGLPLATEAPPRRAPCRLPLGPFGYDPQGLLPQL